MIIMKRRTLLFLCFSAFIWSGASAESIDSTASLKLVTDTTWQDTLIAGHGQSRAFPEQWKEIREKEVYKRLLRRFGDELTRRKEGDKLLIFEVMVGGSVGSTFLCGRIQINEKQTDAFVQFPFGQHEGTSVHIPRAKGDKFRPAFEQFAQSISGRPKFSFTPWDGRQGFSYIRCLLVENGSTQERILGSGAGGTEHEVVSSFINALRMIFPDQGF